MASEKRTGTPDEILDLVMAGEVVKIPRKKTMLFLENLTKDCKLTLRFSKTLCYISRNEAGNQP